MAGVGVAPIGARLASRGVGPRSVSAKRSWPPGCGRFPAARSTPGGDGAKGVIEDRVEEATASQPEAEGTVDVRKEGVGDVRGLAEKESWAIEVMPPACATAAAKTSAVNAVTGSTENGAEPLPAEGSGQLGTEEVVSGNPNGRAADDALGTVGQKRWLMSAVNPPPKRRAISAVRMFPPGFARCCHRPPAAELMKG